ncbi:MAG: hypothetical protein A2Z15_00265 [Chloroflexi bacterium RBG_16_50_11]|nr:MAG: hypothetical protein A2Z15_00265 [Chloroflexi bacterium RBG_16_50_11]
MFIRRNKTKIISIVAAFFLIGTIVSDWLPFMPVPYASALTTEILKPTDWDFFATGGNLNPTNAYDLVTGNDSTTYNRLAVGGNRASPTMQYDAWQTSSNNHSARRLFIRRSGNGNSNDYWRIQYSTNGGSGWTVIQTNLINPALGNTPQVNISTSLDLSLLIVRVDTFRVGGGDGGFARIYDVWLESDFTGVPKVGTQIGGGYPIVVNPSPMTPQQEWTAVTVPIAHSENLSHIDAVEIKLFFDSAGNDPDESGFSEDAQTCAVFTWTRGGSPEWDTGMSGTTWAINTSGSSKPSDSLLQGNWVFSIKIGKVATYSAGSSDWDVYAIATDYNLATGSDYLRDIEMNWYGEVSVNSVEVTWSGVTPGDDFNDTAKQTDISVTYIANGNYYEKIAASSTWTGVAGNAALNVSGTPGNMEFSIKADDTDNLTAAVLVTAYPTYVTINSSGTQTDEAGNEVTTNTLWLKVGNILDETFTGTIYYMINSS